MSEPNKVAVLVIHGMGRGEARRGKPRKLETDGELKDEWINVGHIFQSWNPWSHVGYWKNRGLVKKSRRFLVLR